MNVHVVPLHIYKRVYLPLYKMVDTPFHIEVCGIDPPQRRDRQHTKCFCVICPPSQPQYGFLSPAYSMGIVSPRPAFLFSGAYLGNPYKTKSAVPFREGYALKNFKSIKFKMRPLLTSICIIPGKPCQIAGPLL